MYYCQGKRRETQRLALAYYCISTASLLLETIALHKTICKLNL